MGENFQSLPGALVREDQQDTLRPMNGIHEFVIRGGQTVTAGQMDAFRRKLPFLRVKAEMIDVPDFPHLKRQTNFLVRMQRMCLTESIPARTSLRSPRACLHELFAQGGGHYSRFGAAFRTCRRLAVLRAVLKGHENEFRVFIQRRASWIWIPSATES